MNKHLYAYIPMLLLLALVLAQVGKKINDRKSKTDLFAEWPLTAECFDVIDPGSVKGSSIICEVDGQPYEVSITGRVLGTVVP